MTISGVTNRLSKLLLNQSMLVVLIILATAGVMLVHLVSLTSYPPVFIDEAWNANTAWNWLQTGINFDSMHAGTLDQVGHEWLRWPIIGNAPWRISFALIGLGLFQLRLISWIFGSLLLVVTILVGYRAYGIVTGALAGLILSLSPAFLQASHYGRWDIMLAFSGMLAYMLVITALRKKVWWLHLLAGLLIGISIDIHQNAVLFALGLGVVYLAGYGRAILKSSGALLFIAGGLLGLGYFLAVFILPDPQAYFNLFSLSFGNTHQVPITTLNPLELLRSLRAEIGRFHFYENNLDFALIGAAAVFLAYRRSSADRLLLSFIVTVIAAFVLIIGNKHDIYAILLYPFFVLMVAEALVSLVRGQSGMNAPRLFSGALLILFLFNSGIHFSRPIMENRGYDYYAITGRIRQLLPADAKVMGYPTWWLGLADFKYSSTLNLTYYHIINDMSLAEGFERIKPDYLIVDSNLIGLLVDTGAYETGAGFDIYKLPKQEFREFLDLRGTKVLEFTNPWHGEFYIYSIDWD